MMHPKLKAIMILKYNMDNETIFPDGFIFKKPREGAPKFVKGSMSVKVDEFITFLRKHSNKGWVNMDLLVSKNGKLYTKLNTFTKANQANSPAEITGEVPFGDAESYSAQDEFNVM